MNDHDEMLRLLRKIPFMEMRTILIDHRHILSYNIDSEIIEAYAPELLEEHGWTVREFNREYLKFLGLS